MFGLGITEILLLAVVVVLFWGPEKIPEVARTISKALVQLKRFTNDVKSNVKEGIENIGGKDLDAWKEFQRKVQGKMADLHGQDLSVYLAKLAETLDEDKKALAKLKTLQQSAEDDLQLIQKSLNLKELKEPLSNLPAGRSSTAPRKTPKTLADPKKKTQPEKKPPPARQKALSADSRTPQTQLPKTAASPRLNQPKPAIRSGAGKAQVSQKIASPAKTKAAPSRSKSSRT